VEFETIPLQSSVENVEAKIFDGRNAKSSAKNLARLILADWPKIFSSLFVVNIDTGLHYLFAV